MARQVQVIVVDDLGDGSADETVSFALEGVSYEIDLTKDNAAALRAALQPYVEAGRRTAPPARARRGTGARRSSAAAVRAWAKANGIELSSRGRIPAAVLAQYEAAND